MRQLLKEAKDLAESDSILITSARAAGLSTDFIDDDEAFKTEVIMEINSNFNMLNQLGIGPIGFAIDDETTEWDAFLSEVPDEKKAMVRHYMRDKLKRTFDPFNSTVLASNIDREISELEFRLLVDQED